MTTHALLDIDLGALRRAVRGRVVGPTDEGWDDIRRPWNRRVDQRPMAVVEVGNTSDVVSAVCFAAERGLRVSTQPTGHGAGARLEDAIVLHTGRWRGVTLRPDLRQATVEPGARWGDLLAATHRAQLTGLPGTSPGLSVTGYSLHGGVGLLARPFGFAANDIIGADVVTANGQVVRADAESHSELFWALRGGGGGFGVVVGLDVRLHPAPDLYGGQLIWSFDHARVVLDGWRHWTDDLPAELTSMAAVVTLPPVPAVPEALRGQTIVAVTLCYAGRPADADRWVSFLRGLAPLLGDSLRPLGVGELGRLRNDPSEPIATRVRAETLSDLPASAIDAIVEAAAPVGDSPLGLVEIRHLGGALARPDAGHGAAGHLDQPFLVESVGYMVETPDQDGSVQACETRLAQALEPCGRGVIPASFADPTLDSDRVFDPATRRRLRAVKADVDPDNRLIPTFGFVEETE